jgi:hypothetical protein
MFDKGAFDKAAFDRQTGEIDLYAELTFAGNMEAAMVCVHAALGIDALIGVELQPVLLRTRVPVLGENSFCAAIDFMANALHVAASISGEDIVFFGELEPTLAARVPFSADIDVFATLERDYLKNRIPLIYEEPVVISFSGDVLSQNVATKIPIAQTNIFLDATLLQQPGFLRSKVPIAAADVPMEMKLESREVSNLGSQTLTLQNLNLSPGQTLIIDTDTLEVFINGQPNVTYITTDSTFFRLVPGDNSLYFRDGETSRTLQITAVWSNWWL